jgi:hypothetical protein
MPVRSWREIAENVAKEFVGSALTILSIYGLRKLVELLSGKRLAVGHRADTLLRRYGGRGGVRAIRLAGY